MKFYVAYEYYTDYNQFEGSWDQLLKEYPSLEKAREGVTRAKGNDTKNVIGPLVVLEGDLSQPKKIAKGHRIS